MSKKSKKKPAPVETQKLSKKERKALQAEAARIERELAERKAAKKASKKKGGKKAKGDKPAPEVTAADEAAAEAKAERARKRAEKAEKKGDPAIDYVQSVIDSLPADEAKRSTPLSAGPELKAALDADTDAAIKARVQAKRSIRLGLPDPDTIDRDDEDAVRAYNEEAVKVGALLITSNAEREKVAKRGKKSAKATTVELAEPIEVDPSAPAGPQVKAVLDAEAAAVERAAAIFDEAERAAVEKTREAVEAIGQAIEAVETEAGREFVAGAADAPLFVNPSDAPQTDFATNGNGQYLVQRPSDGKLVGYTRVTTYIACLEDTTMLEKWKARILLEGVAAVETMPLGINAERGESVVARVNDLAHNRDLAIAKARKADRKGKLEAGQLGHIVEAAWSDFKKALDKLADEVFEVGGGREKATKGTDIHELCMIASREGIQPIADKLTAGEITPADLADVEAFLDAITRLGAKIIDVERVVVNDDLKVAGRLDYTAMVKLPGEQRARRRVMDLKTGRVDYCTGKISQQLEMYASATGYDLNTHEREDLKLDRAKAILIHLPAGTGAATVHVADLTLGRKGNRLAGEVRAWRNEGKKAIDLKVDVLAELAKESTD